MFSMGKFLPYVLEGGFNGGAVVLSSVPYVLPILIAVLYLALYGLEKPVIAATTVISLAIMLYVLLMGSNPMELLFLSKSLDFVMPFLLIPTALVIASAMRRRFLLKAAAYTITAVLIISLPMFAVLTLYTYSLPTSSTLTVYRMIDYEEFNAIYGLIPRNSTLYSSVSYGSMIMFMTGINSSDPTTYLLHGETPSGLLMITERNIRIGFLYGSGYSMVSIPRNYLLNTLSGDDLAYSSRTLWIYSSPKTPLLTHQPNHVKPIRIPNQVLIMRRHKHNPAGPSLLP
ncbi:hypothetical protein [Vulcanisaeta distributa]|uniref:hypothetical protein n=1 Tax=Vulcanisaeta distributa TaxID=164451 RepID=UPI001FB5484F|nr:hypothetical protein [Vulcanisaeta distributa]